MQEDKVVANKSPNYAPSTSWAAAYGRFLRSQDENVLLKIAPLALVGILPLDILANLVPIVGEVGDVGYLVVLAVVITRTLSRVRKYR